MEYNAQMPPSSSKYVIKNYMSGNQLWLWVSEMQLEQIIFINVNNISYHATPLFLRK